MISLLDLPLPQRKAIDLVREAAVEKDCHPYLVGGPVRDLILGRQAIDVDLTVENDSSTLARAIAKKINGRVRSFPQFLTYKIVVDGMPEIDIATARKEKYRSPGALPSVAPGRLRDDLLRRDFSMNAIALDLIEGTMHDPANGTRDIESRVVRVLHDQSFVDDPTRIFRAIRLARRLDFTIDQSTLEQMNAAIAGGALETISRERLWRELSFAMDEDCAPEILVAFMKAGVLRALFPLQETAGAQERLRAVRDALVADPDADRYVLYTGVLLREAGATPSDLEGSGFSQKRARTALLIANELPRVARAVADSNNDRQRFRIFKRLPEDVLTTLTLEFPDSASGVRKYREFRAFSIPIRGNDLEIPTGPHIAKALERTREAVFTGEVPVEDARSFARDLALKYFSQHQPEEIQS